MYNVDQL